MTNIEFYQKWNNTEELKIVVNAIIVRGLGMYNRHYENHEKYGSDYDDLKFVLEDGSSKDLDRNVLYKIDECYTDLIEMSNSFIKNVIKKEL